MIFLTWLTTVAGAATLNVPSTYTTIQDAINVAVPGDEIVLSAGFGSAAQQVYIAPIVVDVPNLTIKSGPRTGLYNPITGTFDFPEKPKIVPFALFGAAVDNVLDVSGNGTLHLDDVVVSSNGFESRCLLVTSPPLNPGEYSVTMTDVEFESCQSDNDGGAMWADDLSAVSAVNTTFNGTVSNTGSTARGGVIRVDGTFDMVGGDITGGNAYYGAGMYVRGSGNVSLTDVLVGGNVGTFGGGIYISGLDGTGVLALDNVTAGLNVADISGGFLHSSGGDVTVTGSSVNLNGSATVDGGGMAFSGGQAVVDTTNCTVNLAENGGCIRAASGADITLEDMTILDNSAERGGGIVVESNATLVITDTSISSNVATGQGGGGIAMVNNAGFVDVVRGSITENDATASVGDGTGGGVLLDDTNVSLLSFAPALRFTEAVFADNDAVDGGALFTADGRVTISGGSFDGDSAVTGGCIFHEGTSILIDGTVMNGCTSDDSGGAIWAGPPSTVDNFLTVRDAEINDSVSGFRGGAIYSASVLDADRVMINGTSSTNRGGAIFAASYANLQNVIIDGTDSASYYGSAVATEGTSDLDMSNVTIANTSGNAWSVYSTSTGSHVFNGLVFSYNTSGTIGFNVAGRTVSSGGLVVAGQGNTFGNWNPSGVVVDYQYPFADIAEDTIGTPGPYAYSGLWLRPNSPARNAAPGANPDGSDADAGAFGGASADDWGGPWLWDGDSDGAVFAVDCDDANALYFPGATENPGGAVARDFDCDGFYTCYADADGDGFGDDTTTVAVAVGTPGACDSTGASSIGGDCNDNNEDINPESEVYVDSDNDGYGDENAASVDACSLTDLTGYSLIRGDCDDSSASVNPGAFAEVVGDEIDQNCDGFEICYVDIDNDGFGGMASGTATIPWPSAGCASFGHSTNTQDCDDSVGSTNPAAAEIPGDGVDSNCDNQETCYVDQDGDGFGSTPTTTTDLTCSGPNLASVAGDCNDNDVTSSSGTTEIPADGIDQDCDGTDLCFVDGDFDGFGDNDQGYAPAPLPGGCGVAGFATIQGDCDDSLAVVNPAASEVAGDNIDANCDGLELCYNDGDFDGFGSGNAVSIPWIQSGTCQQVGYATQGGDCDDTVGTGALRFPGNSEVVADGIDQDCDNQDLCYVDADQDGYGDEASFPTGAPMPLGCNGAGFAATNTDCDDTVGAGLSVYPGATEVPGDGIDQDCDGNESCYADADGDGFGAGSAVPNAGAPLASACTLAGFSATDDDCEPLDGSIYPGVPFFFDSDGDGFGGAPVTTLPGTCVAQAGWVLNADDCDDNDGTDFPGALYYIDDDGDGYGVGSPVAFADCGPSNVASIGGDCDDANSDAYPGATEVVGNGVDEDCDALVACWEDGDGDGYATWLAATVTVPEGSTCASAGHATLQGDCEDDASNGGVDIYPGAVEDLCDGIDSNCNCSGYPGEPAGTVDGIDNGGNSCGGPDQDFDMDGLTWLEEPDVLDADCDEDLDDDGLLDGEEGVADPMNPDSDGDGILDGEEVEFYGGFEDDDGDGFENVIDDDDDDDGLLTSFERTAFVAPTCGDEPWRDPDIDGDGVEDGLEGLFDVDMDGVPAACDADESFGCEFDPAVRREELRTARASAVLGGAAYPTAGDADGDGLLDQDELGLYCEDGSMPDVASCDDALHGRCEDGAEALAIDSDADGRADWLDDDDDDDGVLTADESTTADPDGDGLPDYLDPDSDGDGIPDGQEDGSDDTDDTNDTDGPDDNDGPGDGGDGGGDGDDDDKDSGGCGHLPGTQAGWLILLGAAALRRRRSA
ncbi:MAG: MopE-related protein [Myxococcota bacterium]